MNPKSADFKNVFPIGAVENDCLVSKWGDVTAAFELTLPELFTLNIQVEDGVESGDYRDLVEAFSKAIAVLPPHTIVHKQDWFVEETYQSPFASANFLDKASQRHFNERPYLHHACYLFVTKTHPERRAVTPLTTTLVRGRLVPREVAQEQKMGEFFNALHQFVAILESTHKLRLRRLTDGDLAGTDGMPGLLERYMSLSLREEVVTLADIETGGDELKIGSKWSKFYTVADVDDLPDAIPTNSRIDALSSEASNLSVGFAAPVGLMLPCNHIYNQYVFVEDKGVMFAELEKKATSMRSLSNFSRTNAVNAGLVENFIHFAAEHNYVPVRMHFNVQVWTEDKARLPLLRNLTSAAIARMNLRPRETSKDAAFLFWAGIPGNAADLSRDETFKQFVPHAACLLNLETNYYDSAAPYGVKVVDRLAGKPLLVDMSDDPMKQGWITNRNKFILGPSGSGKSFLTNHLLRAYHTAGSHAVVVDVGHSYRGLCELLGGRYLTYSEERPIHFNPFFVEVGGAPDVEKKESIKVLLQTLWKRTDERQTMSEYTALSAAVNRYYEHFLPQNRDVFPCFDSFYEFMLGDFREFLERENVRDEYFHYDNFLFVLKPFYRGGEYDYLLNSRENLGLLHERFVVFELDTIKDHPILFPVVTIIIMDTFIAKMRKLGGVRKIILIEEAWKAIMKDGMAEAIRYLYKTVRKFYGEAWIVTQEVDDIIGSKIVKESIINNADTKILLDQRKYQNKFRHVQELLALTNKEKDLCLSLNRDLDPARRYKEFFVSFGGQVARVYGLEVSQEEYFAYTTEEREKLRVQRKVEANGGCYEQAIREVVEELVG